MRIRNVFGHRLHPDFDKPEVLAFVAALLGWREGLPAPIPPKQMTLTVEELMADLQDAHTRKVVVERLSPLVKPPNRTARRAAQRGRR